MDLFKRYKLILELRAKGQSYIQIGSDLGISTWHVRDIANKKPPTMRLVKCFACKVLQVCSHGNGKYKFCSPCYGRFFFRPSGSEVDGRDRTREIVRIRDKHLCRKCKKQWTLGMRRFDIHHLDGNCGKKSHGSDSLKDIPKLITLCHVCHMNTREVRKKMISKTGNVKTYDPRMMARIIAGKKKGGPGTS